MLNQCGVSQYEPADRFLLFYYAVENRGFNNCGLLKLGWVEYNTNTGNRRRTPRITELKLRLMEELYENRKYLISAMKNAERFISLVFGSDEGVWVARCSSIIRDRR
jgi:hypothetical protein